MRAVSAYLVWLHCLPGGLLPRHFAKKPILIFTGLSLPSSFWFAKLLAAQSLHTQVPLPGIPSPSHPVNF